MAACEEDTDAAICLDLNRIVRSISCRLYNSFSFLQGSINGSFCQRVFHTKYYGLLPILKNTAYSLIMCPCTKLDNNQDLMEISAHRLDKGTYCPAQSLTHWEFAGESSYDYQTEGTIVYLSKKCTSCVIPVETWQLEVREGRKRGILQACPKRRVLKKGFEAIELRIEPGELTT